jgi:hypothetical protein
MTEVVIQAWPKNLNNYYIYLICVYFTTKTYECRLPKQFSILKRGGVAEKVVSSTMEPKVEGSNPNTYKCFFQALRS